MNEDIFIFDYEVNEDILLLEYENQKHKEKSYKDHRGQLDDWKILSINFDYAEQLNKFFNINGKPRFYNLKAGVDLPFHTDNGTECSLNFLLQDKDPTPVTYKSGEYYYKSALLNVTREHGVFNTKKDRLLFKLSIFDEDFNNVKNKVKKALNVNN